MKKLLTILLVLCCAAPLPAFAQTAITLPIAANAVADIGNGPIKVRMIAGNASIFTVQGSGIGSTSGSSTTLTLTGTPATPPIVGGLISGTGITSGTTVTAYNGTTGITLSAAMTVAASTPVAWGAACPSSVGAAPAIQASPQADYFIMYTQARVCAVSPGGPVNTLLIEPIFYEVAPGSGSGTVTSVTCGGGLTGGTFTTTGTCAADTATNSDIWAGVSNKLIEAAGNVSSQVPQPITISTATFTPNFSNGINFDVTLVHASCPCTLANPTNIHQNTYFLTIVQSGTGSDTIGTWGSFYKFPGGVPPSLSAGAGAVDVLPITCRNTPGGAATINFCMVGAIQSSFQ